MKKIPTIFERDWEGDKTVIDQYVQPFDFSTAIATEKLDGMNARLTVRNHLLVRLEKSIVDPWYVDADEHYPSI